MSDKVSAVSLFTQFLPKFREITWEPFGFPLGIKTSRFNFGPRTRASYIHRDLPYFDVQEAGLAFTFTYDPSSEQDPTSQVLLAWWDTILAGPFAGRTFYAEPIEDEIEKFFKDVAKGMACQKMPIKLSHDGDAIPGLHLVSNMWTEEWSLFIPKGTPEHEAVKAALALEYAEQQERKRIENPAFIPNLSVLRARLDDSLAAIAA